MRARILFAIAHQHWTLDSWEHVIFINETKMTRFLLDGCFWCWVQLRESR